MSSIKLDLSQFKHKSSDDKSTTLEHEKHGHTITLAHKNLSKQNKEQLEELAKASKSDTVKGDTAAEGVEKANKQREVKKPEFGATVQVEKEDEAEQLGKVTDEKGKKPKVFAKGGQVPMYAEGDMINVDPDVPMSKDPNYEAPAQEADVDPALARKRELYNKSMEIPGVGKPEANSAMLFGPNGEQPKDFQASQWPVAERQYSKEQADNAAAAASAQQKAIEINQQRTAAGLQPIPVPNVPQGPQIPGSQELPQAGQQAQPQQSNPMEQGMDQQANLMQQGYQEQLAGIGKQQQASTQVGKEQAQVLQDQIRAQTDAKAAYQKQFDALEQERQAHMADIKAAHIDPNKYWTGDKDGNGSHSRIATGIGMILAGFGGIEGVKTATNYLNHQMDMNIKAQEQNLGSEQNLLTANIHQFGNLKDATDMTRIMQADMVHNQLLNAAAKAASPQAQAQALQAAGQLKMQYAPLQQQMAMRQAMMGLANQGAQSGNPGDTRAAEQMIAYARMTNPEMAKEMETRLVPGVGMAKVAVPEAGRSEMVMRNNFNKAAQDYYSWAKQHAGTLNPSQIAEGRTKAAELQGMYRRATQGGVFKEGEQDFIEKLIPSNPDQFLPDMRTLPKIDQLIKSNGMQLNGLKSSYGLPQSQVQQSQSSSNNPQAAMQWAKKNPNDPRAAQILKYLGSK